jgi:hypothetical protein
MKQQRPTALVTRESLQALIDQAEAANQRDRLQMIVGRALIVLFERQTEDEKQAAETSHHNSVGFSSADGKAGVLSAKAFIKHHKLEDWQLNKWVMRTKGFSRITKYARRANHQGELYAQSQA